MYATTNQNGSQGTAKFFYQKIKILDADSGWNWKINTQDIQKSNNIGGYGRRYGDRERS